MATKNVYVETIFDLSHLKSILKGAITQGKPGILSPLTQNDIVLICIDGDFCAGVDLNELDAISKIRFI